MPQWTLLALTLLLSPASGGDGDWLFYERSGGITGWKVQVGISADGAVSVSGTRQDPSRTAREPLTGAELGALRGQVARALALPPRPLPPDAYLLRDGQARRVYVRQQGQGHVLDLSDGRILAPGDGALIRALEALARRPSAAPRPAAGTGPSGAPVERPEPGGAPPGAAPTGDAEGGGQPSDPAALELLRRLAPEILGAAVPPIPRTVTVSGTWKSPRRRRGPFLLQASLAPVPGVRVARPGVPPEDAPAADLPGLPGGPPGVEATAVRRRWLGQPEVLVAGVLWGHFRVDEIPCEGPLGCRALRVTVPATGSWTLLLHRDGRVAGVRPADEAGSVLELDGRRRHFRGGELRGTLADVRVELG